jgi:hypothetical protein
VKIVQHTNYYFEKKILRERLPLQRISYSGSSAFTMVASIHSSYCLQFLVFIVPSVIFAVVSSVVFAQISSVYT